MILPYDASKEERDKLVKERQAKTAAAFDRMREMIDEQTATMNMSTVSEKIRRQQLEEIRNELQKSLGTFYSDLETGLKSDMESIGQSVLSESKGFYEALNMPIAMSITSFPVEVMTNIVNGSVYEQKWYLSGALWGDYTDKLDDINEVITQGIGLNLSTYEIAKNLEKYVDPNARKEWAWSKVYPGTAKTVDYNAQRLARTLINHAYQQNVVQQAKANPFSKGVKWLASGGERMCDICAERDGKVFPADDVPLDHPNGMCTFEVVTEDLMTISNTLADFVNGEPTEYDDALYKWYNDRAEVPIERPANRFAQRLIAEGKDISATWQRRPDEFAFEIEDVMNAQGFDGLPQVVSKEEFERLVQEANDGKGFIAQRTYSAGDQETLDMYRDMLYNGKWYVDCGTGGAQYGQGMYCAADYNGQLTDGIKTEMQHYIELGEGRFSFQSRHQEISDLKTADANRAYNDVIKSAKLTDVEKLIFKVQKENNGSSEEIDKVFDIMSEMSRDERQSILSKLNSVYANATEARKSIFDISVEDYAKQHKIDLYYKPVSYIETLTIDKSAKIIKYSDLQKEYNEYSKQYNYDVLTKRAVDQLAIERGATQNELKMYERYYSLYSSAHTKKQYAEMDKLEEKIGFASASDIYDFTGKVRERYNVMRKEQIENIGSFAVSKGYDAINAEGHGASSSYTVVLNRTKLIIQEP